ncbi:MAG TPA: RDD family protein [Tepidisphaeraceae bacterium]|nr:RDD family protein [Tepidisphaeraceae bacterium]
MIRRLEAGLIDSGFIFVAGIILYVVTVVMLSPYLDRSTRGDRLEAWIPVAVFALAPIIYSVSEIFTGQSLGKLLTQLVIHSGSTGAIFRKRFIRWSLKVLPLIIVGSVGVGMTTGMFVGEDPVSKEVAGKFVKYSPLFLIWVVALFIPISAGRLPFHDWAAGTILMWKCPPDQPLPSRGFDPHVRARTAEHARTKES